MCVARVQETRIPEPGRTLGPNCHSIALGDSLLGYVLERRAASADTLVNLDYRAIWHCMGFARNDITEVFGQEAETECRRDPSTSPYIT